MFHKGGVFGQEMFGSICMSAIQSIYKRKGIKPLSPMNQYTITKTNETLRLQKKEITYWI